MTSGFLVTVSDKLEIILFRLHVSIDFARP